MEEWSQKDFADAFQRSADLDYAGPRESIENSHSTPRLSTVATPVTATSFNYELDDVNGSFDDPNQLEKRKQRKTALLEGIRQFNYKPKRGIKSLIENGFIESKSP